MGPLWIDVAGYELDAEDKEILQHPTVGGVILFARNYHDNEQLLALNASIRKAAKRPILIGVDQEGGRVQRFKEGFSLIPPAQDFAKHNQGLELAEQAGWLMAAELIAHDVDLSFAPVLDKGHECKAIGNRAFGEDKETILIHSQAYMKGMKAVGMATTGKHFPGHGGVITDTHHETAIDERDSIFEQDMAIFKAHIDAGVLDAMMPAHVIFPEYDSAPASGSAYWLKKVLREQLGFQGIVFSDDLSMEGAGVMGTPAERAKQSLDAGCDMLLMCNNRDYTVSALDNLPISEVPNALHLLKKQNFSLADLRLSHEWKQASEAMKRMLES
ncbi:Beta-hexosaminidase [Vibrio nigripulchritudo SFn27]|uniref:Beta-hexosaminidase n=1 Tax=Vibrio nigripulchritudo TaxID=28173 RepID=U4KCR2_9VIBR|nr:beta-N-acetylhexosaminidase [Vibrio nigripulchritudo]CCN83320.1 Beta-hexosaminidase [Vibrio nigripulchritudo BLFn1]CCN86972.1 Beta-hexosaminidase [Vibrio nigripulchritudo SFn27]CCN97440.1 Beta-hexosaminidase [Vibrio nigripulchritudo ENn2]CCO38625.1 Beta-hexosaminidase [Vibrio nigripulchritudo SFn135]CCO52776.1 Beta-hexosaminidase [Vibrio nigripulchritudo Wn13]